MCPCTLRYLGTWTVKDKHPLGVYIPLSMRIFKAFKLLGTRVAACNGVSPFIFVAVTFLSHKSTFSHRLMSPIAAAKCSGVLPVMLLEETKSGRFVRIFSATTFKPLSMERWRALLPLLSVFDMSAPRSMNKFAKANWPCLKE